MSHDLDGSFDSSRSADAGGTYAAPGKRSLTDRVQRRAAAEPPASTAPPPRWLDPSLAPGSYVDSILQRAPTAGPSWDDRGPDAVDLPPPAAAKTDLRGRIVGHSVVAGEKLKLMIGLGSVHGVEQGMVAHMLKPDGGYYNTFTISGVKTDVSEAVISDNADSIHRLPMVMINPSAAKPVQRSQDAHTGLDDSRVHAAAAHGISGAGGALPHLGTIQRAFGSHDVTGVVAHVGGEARDANQAIGGRAYATGNHVAFADAPDLHTAAHEAAHVVQQRAGVHLAGGVGQAGDPYERHADAVADAVVRGESAEGLLGDGGRRGAGAAIQRKDVVDIADGSDAQLAAEEDQFISTFVYYTALSSFRHGGAGPAHPRAQQSKPLHDLAEEVRNAIVLYARAGDGDHKRKALDAWGPARTKVNAVLWRAEQRGVNVAKARRGLAVTDGYLAGDVADDVVAAEAHHINLASPDAGYLLESQRAVDLATNETMALVRKAGAALGDKLKAKLAERGGVPFETWYQLVHSTSDLGQRVKQAQERGLLGKSEGASDLLKKILKIAKYTVSGVNALASVAFPALKVEAKTVFERFAALAGDEVKTMGNVIGVALAVVEICRGTVELIDGVMKGDLRAALKGVEHMASGGVSLAMIGAGAGVATSLMAGGLVAIWFGTLNAVLDVGALLRDMRRIRTLEATYDFVTQCGTFAHEGAELAGAVQAMMIKPGVTRDATLQSEVDDRVEERALELTKRMVQRIKWISDAIAPRKDDGAVGHYRDIVDAIGPRAKALLDTAYLMQDNPHGAAEACVMIFQGIERMGRFAVSVYGDQREGKDSMDEQRRLRAELAAEHKATGH